LLGNGKGPVEAGMGQRLTYRRRLTSMACAGTIQVYRRL
jgi:hypothetical protein